MQVVPKFKIRPLDLVCGYFVMLEMGLAKVSPCAEFEVSSFTHSQIR